MDYPLPSQGGTLPPLSDTSLKATITHYNEMHGHAMSLDVQTAVFNIMWHEISAVLGSLGLDQVEIDRIMAEHLGKEFHHDVKHDGDNHLTLINIEAAATIYLHPWPALWRSQMEPS